MLAGDIMGTTLSDSAEGLGTRNGARARTVLVVATLVALSLPLFFIGLGSPALSDPDEPYYAVPALEMLRAGVWSVPIFHGQAWFDKPILYYAIVRAAFHLLGVSETAARAGSAVAALAGLLVVYWLGRTMGQGRRAALVSSIILGTSLGYAFMARAGVTDMTLTLMLTLGMLGVALYLRSSAPVHAAWAGAAFGLAILTKGPVGIVVPGVALALYAVLTRRRELYAVKGILAGLAGLVVSAGPWFAYMMLAHRDLLVETFLLEGNLGRFLHPEHPSFPLYYIVVLALGLLPWSGALPAALARAARRESGDAERLEGSRAGPLFALCWFGTVLVVFSLSASKLPSYLLPLYPPAALLLGPVWRDALRGRLRHWVTGLSLGLGLLFSASGAIALIAAVGRHGWPAPSGGVIGLAVALVVGAALATVAAARGWTRGFFTIQVGSSVAVVAILVTSILPVVAPWDSTRPLVRELERRGLAGDVVGAFHVHDVSLDFYLRREVSRIDDAGRLREAVGVTPGAIWVVRTADLESLRARGWLLCEPVCEGPHRSAVRLTESGARSLEAS